MRDIDPQDACTIVDVIVEDQFRPVGVCAHQQIVVRVKRQLHKRVDVLPLGTKVRAAMVIGRRPRHQLAAEFVTFSAIYSRFEAQRIARDLRRWFETTKIVRVTTIRALMKSVRLPEVKETTTFEELL